MLSARFHKLRTRSVKAIDWVFAESVFVMPKRSKDEADGFMLEAPLRTDAREMDSLSGARGQGWNAQIAGVTAALYVDINLGVEINEGDRVKALSLTGQPWFEVAFVDKRNHARHIAHLRQL